MKQIVPNTYSMQISHEESYAVTLCARPGCGAELRTKFLYRSREAVQRDHDYEAHRVSVTKIVQTKKRKKTYNTSYTLNELADDVIEGQQQLELDFDFKLKELRMKAKFPSASYLKNSSKPWQRPKDAAKPYAPTGFMVGAELDFCSTMTMITLSPWPDYKSRTIDKRWFTGVVWSIGPVPNSLWVVCDSGLCYLVSTKDCTVLWHKDPRGQESKEWLDFIQEDSVS